MNGLSVKEFPCSRQLILKEASLMESELAGQAVGLRKRVLISSASNPFHWTRFACCQRTLQRSPTTQRITEERHRPRSDPYGARSDPRITKRWKCENENCSRSNGRGRPLCYQCHQPGPLSDYTFEDHDPEAAARTASYSCFIIIDQLYGRCLLPLVDWKILSYLQCA